MSIASAIQTAQTRVANSYTSVANKGGTIPSTQNLSNLPAAINSIVVGVPTASTESSLENYLIEANIGKLYQYTGTTTSKYKNGLYYKVTRGNIKANIELSVEGKTYGFINSSVLSLDQNLYFGAYESTNMNQHNTQSYAKVIVSGTKQLNIWINSYAESNYDYTVASQVDASTPPTSDSGAFGNTKGFQKNPRSGLNTTYWKKLTYNFANTNEHFVWIVFRKDSSVSSGDDKGYFVVEKTGLVFEEYTNQPAGLEPFHLEDTKLERGIKQPTEIGDKFALVSEIGWQALYYAYFRCGSSLVGNVNLGNLEKVGASGMFGAFSSSSVSGVVLTKLKEISAQGMQKAFGDTLVAGVVSFPALESVGNSGLKECFVRSLITKMYFNNLIDCHSSALVDMLKECTTCTEIHFKSGTQSLIQGLDGYSDNFGATNATIYFDL